MSICFYLITIGTGIVLDPLAYLVPSMPTAPDVDPPQPVGASHRMDNKGLRDVRGVFVCEVSDDMLDPLFVSAGLCFPRVDIVIVHGGRITLSTVIAPTDKTDSSFPSSLSAPTAYPSLALYHDRFGISQT